MQLEDYPRFVSLMAREAEEEKKHEHCGACA